MTFMQICKTFTASAVCDGLIKLIYLRRYFEIVDEPGSNYQLQSSLFHCRVVPLEHRKSAAAGTGDPEMVPENSTDLARHLGVCSYPRL